VEKIVSGELVYYRFSMWPTLCHGVFTRKGGISSAPWNTLNVGGSVGDYPQAVRHNHDLIYQELVLQAERACTVWLVHSTDVIIASQPPEGRRWLAHADGMVTNIPDTPLVMRYADCTPLLFYDPVQSVIGISHAGWRGTVNGIGANTVRAMTQAYGCNPRDIQACIGPSIGPNRYQVGAEVVEAVKAYFGTTEGLIRHDPADQSTYLDLWTANRLDLERAGVEQIEIAGMCTAERTDEFFSHRAEKGRTGRFGVVLSL
jgi:purine-nucleoside/S-methyl-5'-thioadenosine phosphorylase / adenosine deaminase